ncbi:Type 1 glutamine amidotransferase-like domain-containing protein [Micrococcoides hystricis]|uniref:Type 1 glutamine amidotransferase-like domain-containing protein n=1 Tax=Micrococcoides hystricis TaxID=1572761 RepID=A0ABV6P8L9_9MICC
MGATSQAQSGHFVLLGGGGFSMNPTATALDRYLLSLTGKENPKVCFVPTAGGDNPEYVSRFEQAYADLAQTHVFTLFGNEYPIGQAQDLLGHDLIFVGGGSTVNLLALWRAHKVPDALHQAQRSGTILAGVSAGANCWAAASSTDSFGTLAPLQDGLGWLPFSVCPHYRGEAGRREHFHHWVGTGELPDGYGIDDGVGMHFIGERLEEVVTEVPNNSAFQVSRQPGGSNEKRLPATVLPDPEQ